MSTTSTLQSKSDIKIESDFGQPMMMMFFLFFPFGHKLFLPPETLTAHTKLPYVGADICAIAQEADVVNFRIGCNAMLLLRALRRCNLGVLQLHRRLARLLQCMG